MTKNRPDPRERARELIRTLGVKSAPIQIEKIIKSLGIVIQYSPFDAELSGMAYKKDGVSIIGVNALHHPNRQRFTMAHELGHHLLHANEITDSIHIDKGFTVLMRDELAAQGVDPIEIEANKFASELLMPAEFVKESVDFSQLDIDDEKQIAAIAKKFKVSVAALQNRLYTL
ncbi:MAG: ImmA/IrrE family metallo-endopeptidase [Caulobacterales bacterium]|nr:ImmA/IrrE family metallo-endopeptidase [Caulobacterales bacterium]